MNNNKEKWEITITRLGSITVEANSEDEANDLVNNIETSDIQWQDSWSVTDVECESIS